ncbi:MAG: CheR family methyltransferase [Candidatus Tumulicola sp.]
MSATNNADSRFEAWLLHETGIDASSLGVKAIERAVRARVRATQGGHEPGVPHRPAGGATPSDTTASVAHGALEAYWQLLNGASDERQALIETLVVPETWFFRDREAFVALARLADERLVREPARELRVLSAPCSTGEEPYSIAMALLDAGIGASRFTIDAIDISMRAIEHARLAVYGRNSFRGRVLEFRERHFSAVSDEWALDERVQHTVRFAQANLFEPPRDASTRYDFIFCRNVLIYFDRDAQDRAIRLLVTQLAEGGTIFVGPAETGLMMWHAMTSAQIPLAFAFQHARPDGTVPRPVTARVRSAIAAALIPDLAPALAIVIAPTSEVASRPATTAYSPAIALRPSTAPMQLAAPPAETRAKPPLSLDDARRFADAGQFDEAERLAHELVIVHGPDANAFHLLGLIADARGRNDDACDFYRKTLYLDPAHYEALTHLAALRDVAGDRASAERLMQRAQRAVALVQPRKAANADPRGFHDPRRH